MFGLQFATLLQLPFGIAVSLLTGTPSEPPPTTFQILWGHPFAAPFFSKSWTLQRNWTWQCPQKPEAIQKNLASFCAIQILVFAVSYWLSLHNASTCFKILEFEGVHFKLGSSCLLSEMKSCEFVSPVRRLEGLWPELEHPSKHKPAKANRCRNRAPQRVFHSFANQEVEVRQIIQFLSGVGRWNMPSSQTDCAGHAE